MRFLAYSRHTHRVYPNDTRMQFYTVSVVLSGLFALHYTCQSSAGRGAEREGGTPGGYMVPPDPPIKPFKYRKIKKDSISL